MCVEQISLQSADYPFWPLNLRNTNLSTLISLRETPQSMCHCTQLISFKWAEISITVEKMWMLIDSLTEGEGAGTTGQNVLPFWSLEHCEDSSIDIAQSLKKLGLLYSMKSIIFRAFSEYFENIPILWNWTKLWKFSTRFQVQFFQFFQFFHFL